MSHPGAKLLGALTPAAGGWNPVTQLTWTMVAWAQGTEFAALGVADGGAVATWPDEVGTRDFAQATGTKQLLYRATSVAGLNSKPALQGDTTDDWMDTGTFTGITAPYSVVILFAPGANVLTFLSEPSRRLMTYSTGAGKYGSDAGQGPASSKIPALITNYVDGASSVIEVNGTAGSAFTDSDASLTRLALNSRQGTAEFGGGYYALVGVASGDIRSQGNWTQFKADAATHYGLTIA